MLLHIYIYSCFFNFWCCHPYILQHFNGNIFTLVSPIFHCILAKRCVREPHPFSAEKMAFDYAEVIVYRSFTGPSKIPLAKGTVHGNLKSFFFLKFEVQEEEGGGEEE